MLLSPFMPETSEKIIARLGNPASDFESVSSFGALEDEATMEVGPALFERLDLEKELDELEKLTAKPEAQQKRPEDTESEIEYDSFHAVELRSAKILSAEPVKKAKKLLKLEVDLGYEKRQIVSGIAQFYRPEDLVGKKVIVVVNLKPVKLCGEESRGMLLASGEETVRVVFLADDTPLGERIR